MSRREWKASPSGRETCGRWRPVRESQALTLTLTLTLALTLTLTLALAFALALALDPTSPTPRVRPTAGVRRLRTSQTLLPCGAPPPPPPHQGLAAGCKGAGRWVGGATRCRPEAAAPACRQTTTPLRQRPRRPRGRERSRSRRCCPSSAPRRPCPRPPPSAARRACTRGAATSRLYRGCTAAISRLYRGYISDASRMYLGCISASPAREAQAGAVWAVAQSLGECVGA